MPDSNRSVLSSIKEERDMLAVRCELLLAALEKIACWPDHDVRPPANDMAMIARQAISGANDELGAALLNVVKSACRLCTHESAGYCDDCIDETAGAVNALMATGWRPS